MNLTESEMRELDEQFGDGPVFVWTTNGMTFDQESLKFVADTDQAVFDRAIVLPPEAGLRKFIFRRSSEPFKFFASQTVVYQGRRHLVRRVEDFDFACVVYAQA